MANFSSCDPASKRVLTSNVLPVIVIIIQYQWRSNRWRLACCCRLLKLFSCHVSSSLFKDQSLPTVVFVVMNLCIESWYLNIYSEVLALHSNVISCHVHESGQLASLHSFSSQLKLAICCVEVMSRPDQMWLLWLFALHLPIMVCASANDLMSIIMEDME